MRMVIAMAAAMTAALLPASADVSSLTADQRAQYDAKLAQCISDKTKSASRASISTIEKNAIRKACEATALAAVTAGPAVSKGSVPLGGGLPGPSGAPAGPPAISVEETATILAGQDQLSSLTGAVTLQVPIMFSGLPPEQEMIAKGAAENSSFKNATGLAIMPLCNLAVWQEGKQRSAFRTLAKTIPYAQAIDEMVAFSVPETFSPALKPSASAPANPYMGFRTADILQHPDFNTDVNCFVYLRLVGPNADAAPPIDLSYAADIAGTGSVTPVVVAAVRGTYSGGKWVKLERDWNTDNPPAGVAFVAPGVEQIVPAVEGRP